jgi:hypothetical protein
VNVLEATAAYQAAIRARVAANEHRVACEVATENAWNAYHAARAREEEAFKAMNAAMVAA